MSYRLRMSAEIGDWLTEVTAAESVAATELGAALVVLTQANELPGPPLVTDLAALRSTPSPDNDELQADVDYVYQDLLEELQHVRREAADAASYRTERTQRFRHFGDGRPDVVEELPPSEEELVAAAEREQELTARSLRLQQVVDAFRTRKEVAKAMMTAAVAARDVHVAMAAADSGQDDEEIAKLARTVDAAADQLKALVVAGERMRRNIARHTRESDDAAEDAGKQAAAEHDDSPVGLFELRADPLGADIRVLFAVEPLGTVTLLAVLDGADAISDHRDEAIALAGELLTEIRAGSWTSAEAEATETGEVCFDDGATLLAKLFPDRDAAIRARAAELAGIGTLAGLRRKRELSIAEVARSSGLSEHRVWEIEHAGLRSVEVHEAAAYVRALGGRLDLTAEFGSGERAGLS